MNACCGHGEAQMAYIQFWDRSRIEGIEAMNYIKENRNMSRQFDEGYKAGKAFKTSDETPNPYQEGSKDHKKWRDGYIVGSKELMDQIERNHGIR